MTIAGNDPTAANRVRLTRPNTLLSKLREAAEAARLLEMM